MGVPALFRWLSQKYPKIISSVVEERPQELDGREIPVDTTRPNPNGEEMDNLYLDMNGIVHPCSHPEDGPVPQTEAEMMLKVFEYTDRVCNMVRPRKLLMIAVDGVAPRAKMNQQRARRFRSAQEAQEKDEDKAEFIKMLKQQNGGSIDDVVNEHMNKKTWDSNAITPGTPFMHILAECLRYWCAYKLNTDPAWAKLKIIISDASVPGEGEHKIMEFIRSQRRSSEHDPNTRHVIYGLDADLIMLGLATHEPHFRVLREDVFFQESKQRTCRICGHTGHKAEECRGEVKKKQGEFDEKGAGTPLKPFIWLHVSILREYLAAEMYVPEQPFKFDLERALDDWVFMCFFVGNDFLPHLPSLDIREQGIDTLIAIWRDNIPIMGGYVTKDGHVELDRAQLVLEGLAKQEDAIFKRRKETEERKEASNKRRKLEDQRRKGNRNGHEPANHATEIMTARPQKMKDNPSQIPPNIPLFKLGGGGPLVTDKREPITHDSMVNRNAMQISKEVNKANTANKSAAAIMKERLKAGANQATAGGSQLDINETSNMNAEDDMETPPSALGKRKAELMEANGKSTPSVDTPDDSQTETPSKAPRLDPDNPPPDTVRLWESGYADRYYEQKFGVDPSNIAFRHKVARAYVEGLAWVLLYYFQGCPSWTWYYPYHYAPFAADFVDINKMTISFDKGIPFRPYEQLMGVLPAASNHAIPEVFRSLMSDQDSPIIDFYPEDFAVDLNGKKFAWQGVVLLPFIDEKRLLAAMGEKYPLLTEDEAARNEVGRDVLLFSDRHPLYDEVATKFYSKRAGVPKFNLSVRTSEGLSGKIEKNDNYLPQSALAFPLAGGEMPDLEEDRSISVHYEMPHSTHIHKSMLLRGVKFPPPALDRSDIEQTKSRAGRTGRSFGGVSFGGGGRGGGGYGRGRGGGGGGGGNGGRENNTGAIDYSGRDNPFAAHLDPNFAPPPGFPAPPSNFFGTSGAFPPPGYPQMPPFPKSNGSGWMPPPPPPGSLNGVPPPIPGYGRPPGGGGQDGYAGNGYQGHQGRGGARDGGSHGGQGRGR